MSLPLLNYSCTYNYTRENSSWIWSFNDTEIYDETLPVCQIFCDQDPPEVGREMTRTWDGQYWDDHPAIYKCENNLAFELPGFQYGDEISMRCSYDNNTLNNTWGFEYNMTIKTELPRCVPFCQDDPPNPNPNVNRTWIGGDWSVNSTATYDCSGLPTF